ncbi:MAG: MFS transporter [Eubacteriales bacterium]
MRTENNTKEFGGYRAAIGLAILMFIHMGINGTVAVFLAPIAEGIGVEVADLSIMISFSTASAAICGMTVAGPIIGKLGFKKSFYLATAIFALKYIHYAYATNLWEFYLGSAYGGFAMTIGTTSACNALLGRWFIEKREQVTAIVLGIFSVGRALFQSLSGYLITYFGYSDAYKIEVVILLVFAGGANFFLLRTPEQLGQQALGADKQVTNASGEKTSVAQIGLTLKEALKTSSFWLLFLGTAVASTGTGFLINYRSIFMTIYGIDTITAANYVSMATLFGSVAVFASGFIMPKMKSKELYISILYGSAVVGGLLMGFLGTGASLLIIGIGLALIAIYTPAGTTLPPNLAGIAFGNKEYGKILVYLISATYLGGCISPLIASVLMGGGTTIAEVFIIGSVVTIVGVVLTVVGTLSSPMAKQRKAQSKS